MTQPMLCTQCERVAIPETVLSGSDLAEFVGWSCLALPGFLYCLWRHWNRTKACASCGSHALMRQSRASLARVQPHLPVVAVPIRNTSGPVRWPAPLRGPRERLRNGFVGTLPPMVALLSWLGAWVGWIPLQTLASLLMLAFAGSAVWILHQGIQVARFELLLTRCRAWDDKGRTLPIERIL